MFRQRCFFTPSPRCGGDYGQVSQGTFEPELSWNATGAIAINPLWGTNVFGSVSVIGRLWLAAYELNIATNKFEEVTAVPHVLFNETDTGLVVRPFSHSGSFNAGAAPLKYVLSPAQTYWLGAPIEVEVRKTLRPAVPITRNSSADAQRSHRLRRAHRQRSGNVD